MKLKIKKGGIDSLSIEHKEEIHIFHKSMDLLISSILNNNKPMAPCTADLALTTITIMQERDQIELLGTLTKIIKFKSKYR